MGLSFQRLMENMEAAKAKHGDNMDTKSMQAIRTGINIREDFWDDFLLVINNSSALSGLLDVPVSTISGWHSKVKHALEQVKQAEAAAEVDTARMVHRATVARWIANARERAEMMERVRERAKN